MSVSAKTYNGKPVLALTINGVTHTPVEWEKITGIGRSTIRGRIRRGLTGEAVIAPLPTPPQSKPKQIYSEVYTEDELYELYRNFAEDDDALQKLADFADLTARQAKPMLADFKKRYESEPHRMSRKDAMRRMRKRLCDQVWRIDNAERLKEYRKKQYAEYKEKKDGA